MIVYIIVSYYLLHYISTFYALQCTLYTYRHIVRSVRVRAMHTQEVSLDSRQPTTKIAFRPVGEVERKRVQNFSSLHAFRFIRVFNIFHFFFESKKVNTNKRDG